MMESDSELTIATRRIRRWSLDGTHLALVAAPNALLAMTDYGEDDDPHVPVNRIKDRVESPHAERSAEGSADEAD